MVKVLQRCVSRPSLESGLTRRWAIQGLTAVGLMSLGTLHGARDAQAAVLPRRRLVIRATDYRFELPATAPSGYTEITLHNRGHEAHHVMFMRLHPGKTLAEFTAAAKSGDAGALFALADSVGGPGSVDPGQTSRAVVRLAAGRYAVICMVPNAHDMPHYQMGMLAPLVVTPSADEGAAPETEATVDLVDFSFDGLPQKIRPGRHVWKVINTGAELHEMVLNRLAPGHSYDEVKAILTAPPKPGSATPVPSAPPPFTSVAGTAPMNSGAVNWVVFDLQPADYFAICFVPDPKTGAPHFDLGMIRPFRVA
ncbi:MAG: hypothetical protein EPN34_08955 [Burkholderiaceae bacterium]|nr:MAG: hypothetical protein EPN34_08955 [Burkholderiaceae bacterium]